MKSLLTVLIVFGLFKTATAQHEIAYLDVKKERQNSNYLKVGKDKNKPFLAYALVNNLSARIQKFQKLAANYDLKKNSIYDPTDPSTYSIEFSEAKNKIIAQYNQEGIIIRSIEHYKNVKLPYAISAQIAQSHPGWIICNTTIDINYQNGEQPDMRYKVSIEQANKRKTITID